MKITEKLLRLDKRIFIAIGSIVTITVLIIFTTGSGIINKNDKNCVGCKKDKKGLKAFSQYTASGKSIMPAKEILAHYLEMSKYPPHSRPLSRKNIDLLNPNKRYEVRKKISGSSNLFYFLTADKHRVLGDESITFTLNVTRGNNDFSKKSIEITSATLEKGRHPARSTKIMDLDFTQSGKDYTSTITPSELNLNNYYGRFFLKIQFKVGDAIKKTGLVFQYLPESTIPAEFTGTYNEETKNGSLIINAQINVKKEGFYIINANLFDASGEPVAYSIYKKNLSKGINYVELLFFGKVLRDSRRSGPYVLKNLRGYLLLPGQNPDKQVMTQVLKAYTTKEYDADSFSDSEYDSEFKRKKIEYLKKSVEIETVD